MGRRKRVDGPVEPGNAIKKKKGFLDGYKTYDPRSEGFGNSTQWHGAFDAVMNGAEATMILRSQDRSPLAILGLAQMPTVEELKKRYRALCLQLQNAFGTNATAAETAQAREVIAAYTVINNQLTRR